MKQYTCLSIRRYARSTHLVNQALVFSRYLLVMCISIVALQCNAETPDEQMTQTYANQHCAIAFRYVKDFQIQLLDNRIEEGELREKPSLCRIRLARSLNGDPMEPGIRLDVVASTLIEALESDSNWQRDEEGKDRVWIREGYGVGRGEVTKKNGLTRISASYSFNCGEARTPGEAMSCDAFAGGVSNGTISVLLDSFGEDAAPNVLDSIIFLPGNTDHQKNQ